MCGLDACIWVCICVLDVCMRVLEVYVCVCVCVCVCVLACVRACIAERDNRGSKSKVLGNEAEKTDSVGIG